MYVPESLWPKVCIWRIEFRRSLIVNDCFQIKDKLLTKRASLKIGDPTDYDSFTSAVIDDKAFKRITSYIDHAKKSPNLEIIGGGKYDDR